MELNESGAPGDDPRAMRGTGIALFERVSGDDYTAVIGLPLTRVVALLASFGVRVLG